MEFPVLIFASLLLSVLSAPRSTPATMAPSFVVDFTALLMFGPGAAMLVATAGAIAHGLAYSERPHSVRRMLLDVATAVLAIQAAAAAHDALGGTTAHFVWPWQGMAIAGAVAAYCIMTIASAGLAVPLVTRRPIDRSWPKLVLGVCPQYLVGASLAAALVEMIDRRAWAVLPVAAVPLYFVFRAYCDYLNRLDEERRRREVIEFLDEGMCVLDAKGRVTFWNDALERIVGCPRKRALGRSIAGAAPFLDKTALPRAVQDAATTRSARTLPRVEMSTAAGARILQVRILPVADGLSLLWQDITERARAEHMLKRSEERLALAAEGANDGLWEWDLRTKEFYFSARWREMIGLTDPAGIGRPEDWFARVHPDDVAALQQAIEAHLAGKSEHFQHEHRMRHEDGTDRRFLCRGIAVRGGGRRPIRMAGSLTDTTERAISQERLQNAAFLDPLTGLCNRAVFVKGLGCRLEELKLRRGGERFAVLYLDLDRFKVVNDSLGHMVGDELLIAASRRLESCLRPGDVLARLGGDEFSILLNGLGDEQQANVIAFRIQDALSAPFSIGGREVFTSASIGIAPGLAQYASPDEIMRDADTAMYHAKSRGKARHEVFDADMNARARDRLGLENDLRHAVSNNDFEVHYQPIVLLDSGRCVGFESLIRWKRNDVMVSPVTFIPIAEELGVIEALGTWVLQTACRTFAEWQRQYPAVGLDFITVNVSSRQLMQQNFLQLVEDAVHDFGLKPCDLRLEITETALMDNPRVAAGVLKELRDFGVKIYLDDFGTGYSSLSHLHKLPVDALKIDRSFVKSLLLPDRPAMVESILALARTLKTSVVAEGVESDVQWRELERLGCTHAQGYLFSRPLSTRAVVELLVANEPLGPKQVPPGVIADDPQRYYSSTPIEYPKSIPA
jgi:diguanylate cyclase (GGDEF)-like protein/PAS domain S-box-containing protein